MVLRLAGFIGGLALLALGIFLISGVADAASERGNYRGFALPLLFAAIGLFLILKAILNQRGADARLREQIAAIPYADKEPPE